MSTLETEIKNIALSTDEAAHIEKINTLHDDMVQTLIQWSHVNSGSTNRKGLSDMRDLLRSSFSLLPGKLTDASLKPGQHISNTGEKTLVEYEPSLLLRVRPKARIQIVFTGHYDTVFPKDSHFQTTRLLGDDIMGGPGVADMKGGILVMLKALLEFEKTKNANNIGYNILLSPDEEIGSPGSAALLAELGKQSHIGLTYEPALADGSMAGARKGSGNFALIIKGRAAHAGREHHLGRNAIAAMARFAAELDALNGQRDGVTFNIAKIDGGGAVNIVPENAVGRFNVRLQEQEDQNWIKQKIDDLVVKINQQDGISAELTGGFTRPPKPMAPANRMIFDWVKQAGLSLGMNIRWKPSGGVCEGNNLWASGCPNVDTLGVCGGEIHSDREFVKLSSLTQRAALSLLLLMKISSGEFDARQAKRLAVEGAMHVDS